MSGETKRRRVRTNPCAIPGCPHSSYRINQFPLCTDHLLRVWKLVEGDFQLRLNEFRLPTEAPSPVLTVAEQEARTLARRQKLREVAAARGFLYVLDSRDGLVKIGWTGRDLWARLNDYPPTFELIVAIRGTRADERDVHRGLKLSRRKGREWYEPTPEVVRLINEWITIRNVAVAQRSGDTRSRARAIIKSGSPRPEWVEREADDQPVMLPRFVSLDDLAARRPKLKATGTEPEGYFRA